MDKPTALQIALEECFTGEEIDRIKADAAKEPNPPKPKEILDAKTPSPDDDPSELIASRFLYRGGVCLLVGPTGIGKSSFLMQLAVHFVLGKDLFGIKPGNLIRKKGMRVLLIQAENDEGDLAEMRDGVLAGCQLSDNEKSQLRGRLQYLTVPDMAGEKFMLALDAILDAHGPFDLILIDPAFAYLGGSSNDQREVSRFMREWLNPILQRHQCGLILAHHTNKPLRGKEKDSWAAGDYAYLGAGSAEWINPARAALAIRSIGSESLFELRAAKRGKRLGWKDENDDPTTTRHISHDKERGIIFWEEADPQEVKELLDDGGQGKDLKLSVADLLHCIHAFPNQSQNFYRDKVKEATGIGSRAVRTTLARCLKAGLVRFSELGQAQLHYLTDKGKTALSEQPSPVRWCATGAGEGAPVVNS